MLGVPRTAKRDWRVVICEEHSTDGALCIIELLLIRIQLSLCFLLHHLRTAVILLAVNVKVNCIHLWWLPSIRYVFEQWHIDMNIILPEGIECHAALLALWQQEIVHEVNFQEI